MDFETGCQWSFYSCFRYIPYARFVSLETKLPQGRKLFYKGQRDSFGEHEVLTGHCSAQDMGKRLWACSSQVLAQPESQGNPKARPEKQWECSRVGAAGLLPPNLSDQALAGKFGWNKLQPGQVLGKRIRIISVLFSGLPDLQSPENLSTHLGNVCPHPTKTTLRPHDTQCTWADCSEVWGEQVRKIWWDK